MLDSPGWRIAPDVSVVSVPLQVPPGHGHVRAGQAVPVGPQPAGDTGAGARGGLGDGLFPPRRVVRLLHGEECRHGARLGFGWTLLSREGLQKGWSIAVSVLAMGLGAKVAVPWPFS